VSSKGASSEKSTVTAFTRHSPAGRSKGNFQRVTSDALQVNDRYLLMRSSRVISVCGGRGGAYLSSTIFLATDVSSESSFTK
jgi:hypothetical protein